MVPGVSSWQHSKGEYTEELNLCLISNFSAFQKLRLGEVVQSSDKYKVPIFQDKDKSILRS